MKKLNKENATKNTKSWVEMEHENWLRLKKQHEEAQLRLKRFKSIWG